MGSTPGLRFRAPPAPVPRESLAARPAWSRRLARRSSLLDRAGRRPGNGVVARHRRSRQGESVQTGRVHLRCGCRTGTAGRSKPQAGPAGRPRRARQHAVGAHMLPARPGRLERLG